MTNLVSDTFRRYIESTYNSTPAAMVLRVEAGITILKPPTVGKEVSWIALSVVRYGGLVQCEENFLVIYRGYHDTTNNRYPPEWRNDMSINR